MRRLLVATAMLMALPGVASAGGGGVDTAGCAGYARGDEISMLDSCFSGTAHFAPSGSPITVSNDGVLPHTLTAVDGSFDTGFLDPGATAELTIDEPGVYQVFCSLHGTVQGEGMAGVLVIGEPNPTGMATSSGDAEVVEVAERSGGVQAAETQVIAVGGDVDPAQMVVLILVGLAVGLGVAAMMTVLRIRVADRSQV